MADGGPFGMRMSKPVVLITKDGDIVQDFCVCFGLKEPGSNKGTFVLGFGYCHTALDE